MPIAEIQAAAPTYHEHRVTFDRMWLARLVFDAPDPNGAGKISALLKPYGVADDGRAYFAPDKPTRVDINDALAAAHSDPTLMAAINSMIVAMAKAADLPLEDTATKRKKSKDPVIDSLAHSIRSRSRRLLV